LKAPIGSTICARQLNAAVLGAALQRRVRRFGFRAARTGRGNARRIDAVIAGDGLPDGLGSS